MKKLMSRFKSILVVALLTSAAAVGAVSVQRSVALGAVSDSDAIKAILSGALRLNESITTPPAASRCCGRHKLRERAG